MKLPLLTAALLAVAFGSAFGQDEALDIPALLKGKLVAQKDGEIVEAELTGDPEYYVIFHSASW